MAKANNDLQFQSYIFSASKYDFNVYEKRILYRMIEIEQRMINQEALDKCIKIEANLWGDKKYTLPIQMLLSNEENLDDESSKAKSKNNKRILDAFTALQDKKVVYENSEVYGRVGVIDKFEFKKRDRFISWKADSKIIEMIMDFSKGWRAYELRIAFNLRSRYAMRFYELIGNKKSMITYKTLDLLKMLEINNKYKRENGKYNFSLIEKYVLKVAQDELDKCCPYTFIYKFSKDKSTINIMPIFQEKFSLSKYEKKKSEVNLSLVLSEIEINKYLEFGFTKQGLKNNFALFKEFKTIMPENAHFYVFQEIIIAIRKKGRVTPGYIIGIIKNHLNDYQSIYKH